MPSATTQTREPRLALEQPAGDPEDARRRQPDAMRRKFRRCAGWSAKHQAVKRLRPSCIATKETAKASPRAPNASGTDIDMKSPRSIEA